MRNPVSTLCAALLAASVSIGAMLPATAMPVDRLHARPLQSSDVIPIGDKWHRKPRGDRPGRDGFHMHHDQGWYNGHKGYRHERPGYRYHNGWWFPAGAFIAGAIIGGAVTGGEPAGSAHIRWCHARYRSYRSWDNSWQPYSGPRRQCVSPYM